YSAARERYRREGKPDQHPARQSARPDCAGQANVRPGRRAVGAGGLAVDLARAPSRSAPGGAGARERQRADRRRQGRVLSQAQPDRAPRHRQPRGLRTHGRKRDDLGGLRPRERAAPQRRAHAGNLSRVRRTVGPSTAAVRANRPPRTARGLGCAHQADSAELGRDGAGHGGEGARGGRRACDGSLSAGPGKLFRGARGLAAALPRPERTRPDSAEPPACLRPALPGARRRLGADGRAVAGRGRDEVRRRRSNYMRCALMTTLGIVVFAGSALAQPSLPSTFRARTVAMPEGASIFVRSGGSGPVVVLLHGYAETSDSWGPLATALAKSYTVVVPDLRGIGRSSRPAGGYDKKTQASDIRAVVTTL